MARTSKTDWLEKGAELLAVKGESALTIDNLTRALGVTKGSFYHHFKSRLGFSQALLAYWEQAMTREIIEHNEGSVDAHEKIRALTDVTTRMTTGKLEVAIRAWALRDPMARRFQERVDHLRLDYTIGLAQEVLGDSERGRRLGTIVFALFVGAQQILPPVEGAHLRRLYRDLTEAFSLFEEES